MTYTHLFLLEAQKEYETALYWWGIFVVETQYLRYQMFLKRNV